MSRVLKRQVTIDDVQPPKRVRRMSNRVPTRSRVPRKSFSRMVDELIKKKAEKKARQYFSASEPVMNHSANVNMDDAAIVLSPAPAFIEIAQGVAQGDRIGNRITITKAKLGLSFWQARQDSTTNTAPKPTYVKCWIYYDKENPSTYASLGTATNFLDNNNSSRSLFGNVLDLNAPINRDRWAVQHSFIVKIGVAEANGTGGVATAQYFTNNDFHYSVNMEIDILPYLHKNVCFNDNNTEPNTRGTYIGFEAVSADGGPLASNQEPVYRSAVYSMEYIDT